jgi:1-phosphofructokinase family hexose kinase
MDHLLVIGLNQTIDRTLRLPALEQGHVLRARDVAITPGGKAVNVCRAARTLGAMATLVGPFPGRIGEFAVELLAAEGIDVDAIGVGGELRGTTVMIEDGDRVTVINEPGPELDADGWQRVAAAVESALGRAPAYVAISGSAPPGTPDDVHRRLIDLVHRQGARVAVDVSGRRLIDAATGGADLVSPNLAEAEQALGTAASAGEAVDDTADVDVLTARARTAAAALVGLGAGAALVSLGRHGVFVHGAGVDALAPAPSVDVVNPVGAGDSLLGGTVVALGGGAGLLDAVRHGIAYAAASVAHPVAGYADDGLLARLLGATPTWTAGQS